MFFIDFYPDGVQVAGDGFLELGLSRHPGLFDTALGDSASIAGHENTGSIVEQGGSPSRHASVVTVRFAFVELILAVAAEEISDIGINACQDIFFLALERRPEFPFPATGSLARFELADKVLFDNLLAY